MTTIQPNNERKFRQAALELALGTADPDSEADPGQIIQRAETFYRYIVDGTKPTTAPLKLVNE